MRDSERNEDKGHETQEQKRRKPGLRADMKRLRRGQQKGPTLRGKRQKLDVEEGKREELPPAATPSGPEGAGAPALAPPVKEERVLHEGEQERAEGTAGAQAEERRVAPSCEAEVVKREVEEVKDVTPSDCAAEARKSRSGVRVTRAQARLKREVEVQEAEEEEQEAEEEDDDEEEDEEAEEEDSSDGGSSFCSEESLGMKNRLRSRTRRAGVRASARIRGKRKAENLQANVAKRKKRTRAAAARKKRPATSSGSDDSETDGEGKMSEDEGSDWEDATGGVGNLVNEISDASEDAEETEETCQVCEFAGAAELMLLCDNESAGCKYAFHTFCLTPPLQAIPEGDWICPCCVDPPKTKKQKESFPSKDIQKLLGRRPDPSTAEDGSESVKLQYLVKWKSYSHHHDSWVPEEWLSYYDSNRLLAFRRSHPLKGANKALLIDERDEDWLKVDRVIGSREPSAAGRRAIETGKSVVHRLRTSDDGSEKLEYLVKWKGMDYDEATWEADITDEIQVAIDLYEKRHRNADARVAISDTDLADAASERGVEIANWKVQPSYAQGGTLHSHQLTGVKWLISNFLIRKSVILADEMGLGKTIQAAVFMVCVREEALGHKPFLVIAPKSTLSGWEKELQAWASQLSCITYQGDQYTRSMIQKFELYTMDNNPLFDVLLTTYELAISDSSILQKFEWSTIFVDEGHRVKNAQSKLSSLLRRKDTDFRVLLTGTPVQNTLTELFSMLHFLDPMEFGDPDEAANKFGHVDAIGTNVARNAESMEEQISRIHDLLRPRMLRRLKTEVLRDLLPGKKLVEVPCALTSYQRRLYVTILKKNYKELNKGVKAGQKRSLNSIVTDLKMCCNHPYLLPGKEPKNLRTEAEYRLLVEASGKFQLLEKLLPLLKKEGHRVLLFSQMVKMLDILEDFLNFLDLPFCRMDGRTHGEDRETRIEEFNDPQSSTFLFLISTRAGGLGINLPTADTVIIYDPDFNPFVDLQAQSRAHRIGQVKTVLVYQLVTKCSVEEKIVQRAKRKLAMENLVMSVTAKEETHDLSELLWEGARSVLDEQNLEATSIKYSDEDLKQLMNRDMGENPEHAEETAGYLGAIQTSDDGEKIDATHTEGSNWDELLGITDEDERSEELGRGKRSRKDVKYVCDPEVCDDEEEYHVSQEKESSDTESDASLDPEDPPSVKKPSRCKTNLQAFDHEGSPKGLELSQKSAQKGMEPHQMSELVSTTATSGSQVSSGLFTDPNLPRQTSDTNRFARLLQTISQGEPTTNTTSPGQRPEILTMAFLQSLSQNVSGGAAGNDQKFPLVYDKHLYQGGTSNEYRKPIMGFGQIACPELQQSAPVRGHTLPLFGDGYKDSGGPLNGGFHQVPFRHMEPICETDQTLRLFDDKVHCTGGASTRLVESPMGKSLQVPPCQSVPSGAPRGGQVLTLFGDKHSGAGGASGQFLQISPSIQMHQAVSSGAPVTTSRRDPVEVVSIFSRYVEGMSPSCIPTSRPAGDAPQCRTDILCTHRAPNFPVEKFPGSASASHEPRRENFGVPNLQVVACDPMQHPTSGHPKLGQKLLPCEVRRKSLEQSCGTSSPLSLAGSLLTSPRADRRTLDIPVCPVGTVLSSAGQAPPDFRCVEKSRSVGVPRNAASRNMPGSAVPVDTAEICQEYSSVPCSLDSEHTFVAVSEAAQVTGAVNRENVAEKVISSFYTSSNPADVFHHQARVSEVGDSKAEMASHHSCTAELGVLGTMPSNVPPSDIVASLAVVDMPTPPTSKSVAPPSVIPSVAVSSDLDTSFTACPNSSITALIESLKLPVPRGRHFELVHNPTMTSNGTPSLSPTPTACMSGHSNLPVEPKVIFGSADSPADPHGVNLVPPAVCDANPSSGFLLTAACSPLDSLDADLCCPKTSKSRSATTCQSLLGASSPSFCFSPPALVDVPAHLPADPRESLPPRESAPNLPQLELLCSGLPRDSTLLKKPAPKAQARKPLWVPSG